jgi:hypothetical protein
LETRSAREIADIFFGLALWLGFGFGMTVGFGFGSQGIQVVFFGVGFRTGLVVFEGELLFAPGFPFSTVITR